MHKSFIFRVLGCSGFAGYGPEDYFFDQPEESYPVAMRVKISAGGEKA